MKRIGKKKQRLLAWVTVLVLFLGCFQGYVYEGHAYAATSAKKEAEHIWYTQKGWTYNGKTLTSMCYITSYATLLTRLKINANPVDVYVANGASNYADHTKIGKAYNVDTSETGSLSSLTNAKKEEKVKSLLEKYPQGIIVGGAYDQSSSHYIVASKVEDGIIYFDDPAYDTEAKGCCITISGVWKLNWSNISMYRVIKSKDSAVATALPTASISPTIKPATESTIEPNALPTIAPTVTPIATPTVTAVPATVAPTVTATPSLQIPTRTLYYTTPIMTGNDVRWLQNSLQKLGYTITENGSFDLKTKNAVIQFQKDKGLSPDGYAGELTRNKIISEIEKFTINSNSTVTVSKVTKLALKETVGSAKSTTYKVTVSFKSIKDVQGYQICYSLKKDFSAAVKTTVTKNTASIKSLKKGKTYYFKVRAYKTVNNKKVYGKYSAVQNIKVKK